MRAETGTHSANCAVDRRDSPGAVLGPVLDMPVVVQNKVRSSCSSRSSTSLSWRRCDPHGLDCSENHRDFQLQFIDKVFDVCCAGPASSSGAVGEETVELPQLQLVEPGHCRAHARRCATADAGWFRVVDVPVVDRRLGSSILGQGR